MRSTQHWCTFCGWGSRRRYYEGTAVAGEDDLAVSIRFIHEFLRMANGGAGLVAVWAAMIQLTDDDAEVRAYNPNQSDEYSGL